MSNNYYGDFICYTEEGGMEHMDVSPDEIKDGKHTKDGNPVAVWGHADPQTELQARKLGVEEAYTAVSSMQGDVQFAFSPL